MHFAGRSADYLVYRFPFENATPALKRKMCLISRSMHSSFSATNFPISPFSKYMSLYSFRPTSPMFALFASLWVVSVPFQVLLAAKGRACTGRQALGHGLVDELGDLNDAISIAK